MVTDSYMSRDPRVEVEALDFYSRIALRSTPLSATPLKHLNCFMDVRLRSLECIRFLIIYRPPESAPCASLYKEFSRLLERILGEHSGPLVIVGDLNFHLDDSSNSHAT